VCVCVCCCVCVCVCVADYVLGGADKRWMPALDKYIRQQGLEVPNFVTSISSCCQSRSSLLTGKYCEC
jgi:hypothetical protein